VVIWQFEDRTATVESGPITLSEQDPPSESVYGKVVEANGKTKEKTAKRNKG
jgi:hypothetical protein